MYVGHTGRTDAYMLHKFVTFQFSIEFLCTAAIVREKLGPCIGSSRKNNTTKRREYPICMLVVVCFSGRGGVVVFI